MRVAVVGAGLVGVASALELARDGHAVTLFERHRSVAAEASFAPAGLVSPSHLAHGSIPERPALCWGPWSAGDGPRRLHPLLSPRTLRWLWHERQAARGHSLQERRERLQRLATYSQARLRHLTAELTLQYERSDGHLVLLRTAEELAQLDPALEALTASGTRWARLDPAQCLTIEPALNAGVALHAGIHLPGDEATNSRQLALLLRNAAEQCGASVALNTEVLAISGGAAPSVLHRGATPQQATPAPRSEPFDAIVVCAGVGTGALLRPIGLALPLQDVHDYSITATMRMDAAGNALGPRSALTDQRHGVVISRIGQRVRVAGGAQIGGGATRLRADALSLLYGVLDEWFPGASQSAQAQSWKGTRATLPDGVPVIGASGVAGIWLHLGHGASGASLACGGARLLADAMAGRRDAQLLDGLGMARLRA